MRVYIVDIDGTIANIEHRLHFINQDGELRKKPDWDGFFAACVDDKPIPHIIEMLRDINHGFVFVTGRPERSRSDTERWLWKQPGMPAYQMLYMRKDGDHRPDHMVKLEILQQMRADGYEPILAFDDRTQVVKMWRENGIPCLQVADGNY